MNSIFPAYTIASFTLKFVNFDGLSAAHITSFSET